MEGITIQGGVIPSRFEKDRYTYTWQDVDGFHAVEFIAKSGDTPQIGDTIVDGVLVKTKKPIINNDHSMWKERFTNTRERDKMDPPSTW